MKTALITCFCSIALALSVLGQNPVPPPQASPPVPPPAASVSVSPAATVAASVSPAAEDDFDVAIGKKIKKHFNASFDHDKSGKDDDMAWIAIPIVFITFFTIFGTPVMIVGLIMYFSFSKSRAMHRTVRMMVEKGQPVPEALLNPPPPIRQRSDLRRGVVLLMVGCGLMVFFGAVNDWEGGAWSLGIIPFLIGAGYLLVWRLDVGKTDTAAVKEEASPKV